MALASGTCLGAYEVVAQIGAGGMGEVYRARDTKLGLDVAIKVLPEAFAHDAERLSRFQREAKMLAALNHPNIGTIFGLEQSGGTSYLVMELVPGETLAERVKRDGPVPIEEALSIAKQIAEALEAAHEKNIIHRDLKPANVKLTPEGKVKVLDFGLAKASAGDTSTEDMGNSPTLSMAATMQGVILGTAAYMSPEQARGKSVDNRTDIWAFGCVLYELLTGKQTFHGEDVTDILAAVVRAEPYWQALPAATPVKIRDLLRRCLQKDKTQRLQAAGDARIEIQEALAAPAPTELVAEPRNGRERLAWAGAVLLALAALGVLSFLHFRETPPADSVLHLSVPLPGDAPAGFLALSPDGRRLVLGLANEGKLQLWLRSLDSPQLQLLPGTENYRGLFWSPDSKSIGFFVDGKLKTMPATGGPPMVLCDGAGLFGVGTWNRDGVILFSTSEVGAPLQRVDAAGGACTAATKPEGDSRHDFPEFLPDGTHFVYVVRGGDEAKRGLYVAALDNPVPRRLIADESSAVFAPSTTGKKYGYLLFLRGSDLMAQPFNAVTFQLAGEVFPVAAEASFNLNSQIAASTSAGGILVYETNFIRTTLLTWLDRSGKELGKVGSIQDEFHVALSPDGKTAATVRRGNQGIWLHDVQRGAETRFTSPTLPGSAPVWSPDGNLIAFGSGKGLYLEDASGGSKEELLLENGNVKTVSDWSRDGRYLIYSIRRRIPKVKAISGTCRTRSISLATGSRSSFRGLTPLKAKASSRRTAGGSPMLPTNPENMRCTSVLFPPGRWKVSAGQGRYREPRWRRDGKVVFFGSPIPHQPADGGWSAVRATR